MRKSPNIAIVGCGITGLALAHELRDRCGSIQIFDRGRPGGLAAGIPFPGVSSTTIEKFYHHLFQADTDFIDLIEAYGLGDDLQWLHSRVGLWADGQCWPLEKPIHFLKFRPLGSFWERLKMGWNLYRFKRFDDWQPYSGITCREYFEQHGSGEGYQRLWRPLLKAKYAELGEETPAAILWGRINPRARSRKRGAESLGYLKGGFHRLIDKMVQSLKNAGVSFNLGECVQRIVPGETPRVITAQGEYAFDRVIWTGALGELAKAIQGFDRAIEAKLSAFRYMSVACLMLVLKRRLGDYYWINSIDPSISFGVLIEHTNLVSPSEYNGKHLFYVGNYLNSDHPFMSMSREGLLKAHWDSLQRVHPSLKHEDVEDFYAIKARHAAPVFPVNYPEQMIGFSGDIPNVDLVGMAQVYPEDRNMSHCAGVARRYVAEAWQDFPTPVRLQATGVGG